MAVIKNERKKRSYQHGKSSVLESLCRNVCACFCFVCSGTFAVISIMIGSVTERLAPDSKFIINGTNETGTVDIDQRDAHRVQIACALTVLTGIFQVCICSSLPN